MSEQVSNTKPQVVRQPALRILTAICEQGGEITDDSIVNTLARSTNLRRSVVVSSFNKSLAEENRLVEADFESEPQRVVIKEMGMTAVAKRGKDTIEALGSIESERFPESTFFILDYLYVHRVDEDGWLFPKSNLSSISDKLSDGMAQDKETATRALNRLKDEGFIDSSTIKDEDTGGQILTNVRIAEDGLQYYNWLCGHPVAIKIFGKTKPNQSYPIEHINTNRLAQTLMFAQREVELLQETLGLKQIKPSEYTDNMTKKRLIREIKRLYEEIDILTELAEVEEAESAVAL